jgi:hypothetical protein
MQDPRIVSTGRVRMQHQHVVASEAKHSLLLANIACTAQHGTARLSTAQSSW